MSQQKEKSNLEWCSQSTTSSYHKKKTKEQIHQRSPTKKTQADELILVWFKATWFGDINRSSSNPMWFFFSFWSKSLTTILTFFGTLFCVHFLVSRMSHEISWQMCKWYHSNGPWVDLTAVKTELTKNIYFYRYNTNSMWRNSYNKNRVNTVYYML